VHTRIVLRMDDGSQDKRVGPVLGPIMPLDGGEPTRIS
jgi:hypothetical protein